MTGKLNAGAFEFVPGKSFALPPREQQQPLPPPVQRPEQTEAPRPPPTISLSIGGSKPAAPAHAPAPVISIGSKPTAPSPTPAVPSPQPKVSAAPAAAKPAVVKKSESPAPPSKTFSLEKSKMDTTAIAKEVQAAADKAVLENLYGQGAIYPFKRLVLDQPS